MPEDNVVVRLPLTVGARSRRRLLERLALRFPRMAACLISAVQRLPSRSRLRQTLLRRFIRQGVEALNRWDFEAVFGFYDRDCELVMPARFAGIGMEAGRGREERIRFQRRWVTEWAEFRFEPEEVIDLGDARRVLLIGRTKGSGRGSGAAFDGEWAALLTVSGGWIVREQAFFDHKQALEAAGLGK
jgi:ketosteroid isomerase-like protein